MARKMSRFTKEYLGLIGGGVLFFITMNFLNIPLNFTKAGQLVAFSCFMMVGYLVGGIKWEN